MRALVYVFAIVLLYLVASLFLDMIDKKITIVDEDVSVPSIVANPNEVVPAIETIPNWENSFSPPSRFYQDNGQIFDRCPNPEALQQCDLILRQLGLPFEPEQDKLDYSK
jgi:hypothetical protein